MDNISCTCTFDDNISCTCTCTTHLTDKWTIHVCISCTCTCTIHLTDKWTIFHVHVHVQQN